MGVWSMLMLSLPRALSGEKLDSITLEYTYLLTSQLESQRLYFEEKMNLVESEARSQVNVAFMLSCIDRAGYDLFRV